MWLVSGDCGYFILEISIQQIKHSMEDIFKKSSSESESCLVMSDCDPMDLVHGILQAKILEWVALLFSRGSSQPRDRIQVSHIAGRFFASRASREAQEYWSG